jgi:hypothetical protein
MKSIYEIYVPVTSHEQADRLKAICVKYGLPIYLTSLYNPFEFTSKFKYFRHRTDGFFISSFISGTQITESEFELLAKEFKQ